MSLNHQRELGIRLDVVTNVCEMWSEEYDDLNSESFSTLASSVRDAVKTTFEDSAEGQSLLQFPINSGLYCRLLVNNQTNFLTLGTQ